MVASFDIWTVATGPRLARIMKRRPCGRLMAFAPLVPLSGRGVLVLLLLGSLVGLRGQQPPAQPQPPPAPAPPEQQRPTFRAGANLVRVDVSVVDHHGEPVSGPDQGRLRGPRGQRPADGRDLQVHAGDAASRRPTTICRCRFGRPSTRRPRPRGTTFACSSSSGTSTTSRRCARPSSGARSLTDFVRNAFGPTDLVALMDPLTPLDAIRFTRDRQALADKVHTLQGDSASICRRAARWKRRRCRWRATSRSCVRR